MPGLPPAAGSHKTGRDPALQRRETEPDPALQTRPGHGYGPALQRRRSATMSAMGFERKSLRLAPKNYSGHGIYFVTACCYQRRKHFADTATGFWVLDQLRRQAEAHSFALHAYCAMPDHLHLLAEGNSLQSDLLAFVTEFKRRTALVFRTRNAGHLWQGKFYDHILRSSEELQPIAGYIWLNPVRKNLCGDAGEYPLSGSETMDWKKLCGSTSDWTPPWKTEPGGG